jgi:putative transposase
VRAVLEVAPPVELAVACRALGLARATLYRRRRPESASPRRRERRSSPPRALAPEEQARVLGVLHSERFVDRAAGGRDTQPVRGHPVLRTSR